MPLPASCAEARSCIDLTWCCHQTRTMAAMTAPAEKTAWAHAAHSELGRHGCKQNRHHSTCLSFPMRRSQIWGLTYKLTCTLRRADFGLE